MRSGLPIDEALAGLSAALRAGGNAVVVAPPGAGLMTTFVTKCRVNAGPDRSLLVCEPSSASWAVPFA